jgi:hypothetical protein
MNQAKNVVASLSALVDRSLGWLVEQLGAVAGAPAFAAMGRHRQLRATVTLHSVQVKAHANRSMRSWKLLDTRLLTTADASRAR